MYELVCYITSTCLDDSTRLCNKGASAKTIHTLCSSDVFRTIPHPQCVVCGADSRMSLYDITNFDDDGLSTSAPQPDVDVNIVLTFLREAVVGCARLAAQWQRLGVVHGMLRTDNVSVLGVALDLGSLSLAEEHKPPDDYKQRSTCCCCVGCSCAAQYDLTAGPKRTDSMYVLGRQARALAMGMRRLASTLALIVHERALLEQELSLYWPVFRFFSHSTECEAARNHPQLKAIADSPLLRPGAAERSETCYDAQAHVQVRRELCSTDTDLTRPCVNANGVVEYSTAQSVAHCVLRTST